MIKFKRSSHRGYPYLDWIQVEVSTFCDSRCVYCPHTMYSDMWESSHMPLELFAKIEPAFDRTDLVYLQGWGEPFLNPDFFDMVKMVKKSGTRTGVTTCGSILDSSMLERIIDEGVDILAFSLAGTGETNDKIRKGTSFASVTGLINELNRIKTIRGATNPDIHIAYMLLKSVLDELNSLPALAHSLGVKQVVISDLALVINSELEEEALYSMDNFRKVKKRIDHLLLEATALDVDIHYQLVSSLERRMICPENIYKSLVVSADGSVGPCVFNLVPVSGEVTHFFRGETVPLSRLSFGSIRDLSIKDIWNDREYRRFRRSFLADRLSGNCVNCHKLYFISE